MSNTIKLVKLNNLQYNTNRDPQVYRRLPNETFHLEVHLQGSGSAKAKFEADGKVLAEETVNLPGKFLSEFSFDEAGTRIGTLTVEAGGQTESQDLRLDVMTKAWVG